MVKTRISLWDLQPTDLPTVETMRFYDQNGIDGVNLTNGYPQVWKTPSGLLVSDGNKRCSWLSRQGASDMDVDLQVVLPEFDFLLDDVYSRARVFQQQGIFSFADIPDSDIV